MEGEKDTHTRSPTCVHRSLLSLGLKQRRAILGNSLFVLVTHPRAKKNEKKNKKIQQRVTASYVDGLMEANDVDDTIFRDLDLSSLKEGSRDELDVLYAQLERRGWAVLKVSEAKDIECLKAVAKAEAFFAEENEEKKDWRYHENQVSSVSIVLALHNISPSFAGLC